MEILRIEQLSFRMRVEVFLTDETNTRPTKVCRRNRVKLIESNNAETILESLVKILKRRFDRARMENDIITRDQNAILKLRDDMVPTKDTPGMDTDQITRHRPALIMVFREMGELFESEMIAIKYDMDV